MPGRRGIGGYLARRLGALAVVLLGVVTATFFVTRELGTPVYLLAGQQGDQAQIDQLEHDLGLDKPILQQFGDYLSQLVRGDLGSSTVTGRPVLTEIWDRLPATLELVLAAMAITIVVGVGGGVRAATHPGGWSDRAAQFGAQLGASIPTFWVGLILIYVFYFELGIAPPPGGELSDAIAPPPRVTGLMLVDSLAAGRLDAFGSALSHLVLPAITLSLVSLPTTLQITRNALVGVLRSPYIRTADAYGMPQRLVLYKYALKNVLVSLVTVLAMTFGFLMSSTVLVEQVFSWPGIGLYALSSTQAFDYAPVAGIVLLSAVFYAVAYLIADLLSLGIDPRIRAAGS
jgi:ABC-type dipeptide/oligopeptide/nickel transport system permease component